MVITCFRMDFGRFTQNSRALSATRTSSLHINQAKECECVCSFALFEWLCHDWFYDYEEFLIMRPLPERSMLCGGSLQCYWHSLNWIKWWIFRFIFRFNRRLMWSRLLRQKTQDSITFIECRMNDLEIEAKARRRGRFEIRFTIPMWVSWYEGMKYGWYEGSILFHWLIALVSARSTKRGFQAEKVNICQYNYAEKSVSLTGNVIWDGMLL